MDRGKIYAKRVELDDKEGERNLRENIKMRIDWKKSKRNVGVKKLEEKVDKRR